MDNDLPLTGVRVVALEQAVTAPFCSRQLADMGADVIKVERPGSGDRHAIMTAFSMGSRRISPGSIGVSAASFSTLSNPLDALSSQS